MILKSLGYNNNNNNAFQIQYTVDVNKMFTKSFTEHVSISDQ